MSLTHSSTHITQHGRTSTVGVCVVCAIYLGTPGCKDPCRQHVHSDSSVSSSPIVVFWQYPAYPLPGEEVRGGLVAAAWKDGRVVRVGEGGVGRQYVTGTLSPSEIERLHILVAENARFVEEDDVVEPVPDDVSYECMYISDSGVSAKCEFAPSAAVHTFPRELRTLLVGADLAGVTEARTDWSDLRSLCDP